MNPAEVRAAAVSVVWLAALALLLAACAVTESPATSSEGNIGDPVELVVGTTHAGSVSGDSGQTESYYTFKAKAGGGAHTITLYNSAQDVAWYLFDDATFTTLLVACDNKADSSSEVCVTPALLGGLSYYLRVHNKTAVGTLYYLVVE